MSYMQWLWFSLVASSSDNVVDDSNLDENSLNTWKSMQHCKSVMPKIFYEEWQIILRLHLVLVTLHGRFTIAIEQDK